MWSRPTPTRRRSPRCAAPAIRKPRSPWSGLMDRLARTLNLDRAELRRRNLIPAEKMPYLKPLKTRAGEQVQYDSGDYPGCQARDSARRGLGRFPAAVRPQRARKAATSASALRTASKAPGAVRSNSAACACRRRGRITVSTGAAAMGQGLATALAQICAEAFGVRAAGRHGHRRRHGGSTARARRLRQPTNGHRRFIGARRGRRRRGQGAQARQSRARSRGGGSWKSSTARCASSARRSLR